MKFGATLIWLLCDSRRCSDWVGKTVPEEKLLLKLGRISVYIAIVTSIDRGTPKHQGLTLLVAHRLVWNVNPEAAFSWLRVRSLLEAFVER